MKNTATVDVLFIGNRAAGSALDAIVSPPTGALLLGGNRAARGIYGVDGTPEGVLAEGVGALALRRDSQGSATFYIKEIGSGISGWRSL